MEKKTKLTISGSAKKSIKNIEIAKTQGKNSVVIEKQPHKTLNKQPHKTLNRSGGGGVVSKSGFKPKTNSTFKRGNTNKTSFSNKSSLISNDFEKRKLAEQRATKRLKNEFETKDKKNLKTSIKKRDVKLTVSRALSDEIEARQRSLASVKRARLKENKTLPNQ